jgi:hypothetical protein
MVLSMRRVTSIPTTAGMTKATPIVKGLGFKNFNKSNLTPPFLSARA